AIPWKTEIRKFLQNWTKLLSWKDIYNVISKEVFDKLPQRTVQTLTELPFFVDDSLFKLSELCNFRSQKPLWALDSVLCLQKAVDKKLIEPEIIFDAATSWGVMPNQYIEQCSPRVKPLFLEVQTDLPAIEIKYVVHKVIVDCRNLDTDKVASNLLRYKDDPEFKEITTQIKNVILGYPRKFPESIAKQILEKLDIEF
ncbi:MAG: hypothetical protein ACW99H_12975, partial [Candidatus Thorarchaeota archaeon]